MYVSRLGVLRGSVPDIGECSCLQAKECHAAHLVLSRHACHFPNPIARDDKRSLGLGSFALRSATACVYRRTCEQVL